jgi:hypothetical protein
MGVAGTAGVKQDLLIKQGSTFKLPFLAVDATGAPVDLTGCTILSQIRKTTLSSVVTQTFTALIDPDPTTGRFALVLSAAQTSAIPAGDSPIAPASQYVWDVELHAADTTVAPLAYGVVKMHPEVTR